MTSDPNILMQTGLATNSAKLNKAIQPKFFVTDATRSRVKKMDPGQGLAVGQIIGHVVTVKEKDGDYKGQPTKSWLAIGELEAIRYDTGEIQSAYGWYGPGYFLETIGSIVNHKDNIHPVPVAVELWLEATKEGVGVRYMVKNLAPKRADSPLNELKRQLERQGVLALPKPPELPDADTPMLAAAERAGLPVDPERFEEPDEEAPHEPAGQKGKSKA